jgi:hypothetical protein
MRSLESHVLARAIPTALAGVEDGEDVVAVEDHRLTPVYCRGALRFLFVLPAACDAETLRQWRHTINAGCAAYG